MAVTGRAIWPRPAKPGHLVYLGHEGTLSASAFDPRRLELLGTPAPLLDDVGASADLIRAAADSSRFPIRERWSI